jgi:hypothetical protein
VWPIVLGVGLAVIVVAGGVWFFLSRRGTSGGGGTGSKQPSTARQST